MRKRGNVLGSSLIKREQVCADLFLLRLKCRIEQRTCFGWVTRLAAELPGTGNACIHHAVKNKADSPDPPVAAPNPKRNSDEAEGSGDPVSGGIDGWYSKFGRAASRFCGRPPVFTAALAIVVIWAISGPFFNFDTTWQLVINTGTTIITFLMVFLIQGSQNRDTEAIQVKLDELIRATQGAHNALIDLEDIDEDKLEAFRARYEALAVAARAARDGGGKDTDTPEA